MNENQLIQDILVFQDNVLVSEFEELEYKSACGGFPGSFWETYSAFANTSGGVIVLGVKENKDKGEFKLDHLTKEQVEKYRKQFWNDVNNKSKVNRNICKNDDVKTFDIQGCQVLVVYVPRASFDQRPVYCGLDPYNGAFKRNYEGDYKCTTQEIQRMFADADTRVSSDMRILHNYSMNDIDTESLQQYRRLFQNTKPNHPWSMLNDMDFLKKLGAYREDRTTKDEGFTVAGLLMFGKYSSITDSECTPHFFPDYQEYLEENPRWSHRIYPDGMWEANLFQFYQRVMPRLLNTLPKPFQLQGTTRIDETPAHASIREAFMNSCIHADYAVNASLTVRLYRDRMEFSNPGTMLISLEQYYRGGESVCRNKTLQTMFMLIGNVEKAGSGADKIIKGWRACNWRLPDLKTKTSPDKVDLTLPLISILDESTKNRLTNLFGPKILGIDHNKLMALALACIEESVTNRRLSITLDLHKADITQMLKELCQADLLVSEGVGRGTHYYLPTKNESLLQNQLSLFEHGDISNQGWFAKVDTSKVDTSKVDTSKVDTSKVDTSTIKRKFKREDLFELISNECLEWTSLEEISKKVNRKPNYLINKIIPEMIANDRLEPMYPKNPHHPNQKYKRKA